MRARGKLVSTMATCLVFSLAMSVAGLTGGCGDGSQSPPDEATKAKNLEIEAKVKEAHNKKRLD